MCLSRWLKISRCPAELPHREKPLRVEVCKYDAEYRPLQPWVTHSNDSFMDGGKAPTCWMPLPPTTTNAACENCINWEVPEPPNKQRGRGYCVIFDKETTATHGSQCTAFDPWPDAKQDLQTHDETGNEIHQSQAGESPIQDSRLPLDWHSRQRCEALRLFRVVHGPGDSGSEQEFNCLRVTEQSGWLRLAAKMMELYDDITWTQDFHSK